MKDCLQSGYPSHTKHILLHILPHIHVIPPHILPHFENAEEYSHKSYNITILNTTYNLSVNFH